MWNEFLTCTKWVRSHFRHDRHFKGPNEVDFWVSLPNRRILTLWFSQLISRPNPQSQSVSIRRVGNVQLFSEVTELWIFTWEFGNFWLAFFPTCGLMFPHTSSMAYKIFVQTRKKHFASSVFLPAPLAPLPMHIAACTVYAQRVREVFFSVKLLKTVPLGERHVVLTDHVFNEWEESRSLTLTHLSPLRWCSGSTSLTSQASGIDHLMILKYSQDPHNNKNTYGSCLLYTSTAAKALWSLAGSQSVQRRRPKLIYMHPMLRWCRF